MTNVYTLKDINNKGHRLGSAYEQELKKKLYTTLSSKAEINDLCEKLLAKNSEYSEREEEFQRIYADMGNKASQLNASSTELRSQLISERKSHSKSQRELEVKYTAEIKSLKSNIKTLKREATLAQKASSADKVKILSLETKVVELEGKLEDLKLDPVFHDSNVVGGVIEEPAQINSFEPKEIDSLRLELEWVKEDFNSKKHEIECMEKGIEATHEITSRERDALSSARLNLIEENSRLRELVSKKDNEVDPPSPPMNNSSQKLPGWLSDDLRSFVYKHSLEDKVMKFDKSFAREHILEALQELLPQDEMVLRNQAVTLPNQSVHSRPAHSEKIISREGVAKQSGGAEVVSSAQAIPLAPVIPIVADSLMSPMLIYSILTLLLIAIIWFVVGKKIWNSWSAKPKEKSDRYIQTSDLHLWAYPRPGYMIRGRKFEDRN